MKLYKDGTVEGTPAEIAEYNKLTTVQQHPFKVIDPLVPKKTIEASKYKNGLEAPRYTFKGIPDYEEWFEQQTMNAAENLTLLRDNKIE